MASVIDDISNRRGMASERLLPVAVLGGAIAVLAIRLWIMSDLPLWLDETWTAMIVTRPDWPSFAREAGLDVNPPFYYLLIKLWVAVAGDSNFALRVPSFLFSCAAAVAPLIWRPAGLGKAGAWTWAALILFWAPGTSLSFDARGYALLLLLSTLASLVFARLYDRLESGLASLWIAVCSLAFLTHYFAAILIAAQGLVLLHRHKLAVVRCWPAALVSIPSLGWAAWHLRRAQEYARPDVAWYERTDLVTAASYVKYVVGPPSSMFLLLVTAILAYGMWANRQPLAGGAPYEAPPGPASGVRAAACAGLVGLALALVIGAMRASLTDRYLVPLVPSVMLGIVLVAQHSRKRQLLFPLLVVVFAVPVLNAPSLRHEAGARNSYGIEAASRFVAQHRPSTLTFTWDHPNSKILDHGSLANLGGYFLRRSGSAIPTTAVVLDEREDGNVAFAKAAAQPSDAFIWLYNTRRPSAARTVTPALQHDSAWDCHAFRRPSGRDAYLGVLACVRKDQKDV